jgi:hypothetical protein
MSRSVIGRFCWRLGAGGKGGEFEIVVLVAELPEVRVNELHQGIANIVAGREGGSIFLLVFVLCSLWEIFQPGFGEPFEPFCLGEKGGAEAALHAAFADSTCEAGNGGGAASDADVRVLAVWVNAGRDDPAVVGFWQFNEFGCAWRLFIEDRSELGFGDESLKNSEFSTVKIVAALILWNGGKVEQPDANFANLEGIEHVHCNGVCPLVGEMSADSAAELFVGLSDVDRFSVVVEKGVNAPLVAADSLAVSGGGCKECVYLLADGDDITGRA